ncbi:MAG: VOC family protein [Actinomycetota bacterium]
MATEINAITLVVTQMARSVDFYTDLGFTIVYGGSDQAFTSLSIGANYVNLQQTGQPPGIGWGRVIFHVDAPDETHATAIATGHRPEFEPSDAPWGERYFHIRDPDGHELSFARRLSES